MYSSNSRRFTSFFVPTNKTKGQLGALSILLSHGRFPLYFTTDIAHYAGEQSGADNSASGSIKLAKERIELMKLYGIIDEKK